MALRNLINWNDPIFRQKSRPVENFNERLWTLLDDMRETLEKVGGVGLAAVHVGILRRVVVILEENYKNGVIELINPVITETSEKTCVFIESSIAAGAPQKAITRPKNVTVSAFDRHSEPITITGNDFLAATLCHEIDHLDGILFTDKIND